MRHSILAFLLLLAGALAAAGAGAADDASFVAVRATAGPYVRLASTTTAVPHTATLSGPIIGDFMVLPGSDATSPAISFGTGYDPSAFFTNTDGSHLHIQSSFDQAFQPDCDTSRTVSPLVLPVDGGQQTTTISITCSDAVGPLFIFAFGFVPGTTLVSGSGWAPLDSGGWGIPQIDQLISGATYTFTLTTQSPNPFGAPYAQAPDVQFTVNHLQHLCPDLCGPQSSLTVPMSSLDGPTAGTGSVTFSAGEPHVWTAFVSAAYEIDYAGAVLPASATACKNDGWQAFAAFKNQGDCVSYVATTGKNPPSG